MQVWGNESQLLVYHFSLSVTTPYIESINRMLDVLFKKKQRI